MSFIELLKYDCSGESIRMGGLFGMCGDWLVFVGTGRSVWGLLGVCGDWLVGMCGDWLFGMCREWLIGMCALFDSKTIFIKSN